MVKRLALTFFLLLVSPLLTAEAFLTPMLYDISKCPAGFLRFTVVNANPAVDPYACINIMSPIPTLEQIFDAGNIITGATSNRKFIIGDSVRTFNVYADPTQGMITEILPTGNEVITLAANRDFIVRNASGTSLFRVNNDGTWTIPSRTTTQSMQLSTISVSNANAFVDTIDGTNFDYSGVRFLDGVTGNAFYSFKVPANLATVPAWGLVLSSKAISGSGGNVFLQLACKTTATNVALDGSLTTVYTAAAVAINTSANLTTNTLVKTGTDNESPLAIVAGDMLYCNVQRQGGDSGDTLNSVDWLLLDVSVRFNIQ